MAWVSCDKWKTNVLDVELNGVGILSVHAKCRWSTFSTTLYAPSNKSINHTNFIPSVNTVEDDCCIQHRQTLSTDHVAMESMELNNLNLDEPLSSILLSPIFRVFNHDSRDPHLCISINVLLLYQMCVVIIDSS